MKANHKAFLTLLRLGIGNQSYKGIWSLSDIDTVDWDAIEAHANIHGLLGVVIDGIDLLPEGRKPPKSVLLQWIGEVLQGYEYRYELYRHALKELANFYNSHEIHMMVLKGYACGLNWPRPEHRPCGDIDIWLYGKQDEADSLLLNEKGVKVDKSEHHHTLFYWDDFLVENHYDFLNIHQHKSSAQMEIIFKELGADDSHSIEIDGVRVNVPSPNLHALFLLKHSMVHFAAEGINLRQMLDWAFFVKSHRTEIDWTWLENTLEQYGMKPLYEIYNAICVEDLGFSPSLFQHVQFNSLLKERVLKDILEPDYSKNLPSGMLRRVIYKYRRWKANEWKRKLCFKESTWTAFWSGVWNHLLKPSTI